MVHEQGTMCKFGIEKRCNCFSVCRTVFPHIDHFDFVNDKPIPEYQKINAADTATLLSGEVKIQEWLYGSLLSIGNKNGATPQLLFEKDDPTTDEDFMLLLDFFSSNKITEIILKELEVYQHLFVKWFNKAALRLYEEVKFPVLGVGVYDTSVKAWWSTNRRDELLSKLGLPGLQTLVKPKHLGSKKKLLEIMVELKSMYTKKNPIAGIHLIKEGPKFMALQSKLLNFDYDLVG